MQVNLYPSYECILVELSNLLCFEFKQVGKTTNVYGSLQYKYTISAKSYVRKADVDDFILHSAIGTSYARATVLYSLYACRHLVVADIEYPSYQDWQDEHHSTLDHKLPRKWFPRLTFDCTNWQPKTIKANQEKGDEFLDEGIERLDLLAYGLISLKHKYI
ncbi:MAG: hypothetical protein AAGE84_30295 [Cyanobacteria bacterium P01_G01_bin.39]